MKRPLSILLIMFMAAMPMTSSAQGFFSHMSGGLSLGTDGIGLDVGVPITSWLQVRAGYDFMSVNSLDVDFDLETSKGDSPTSVGMTKVETDCKLSMSNAKLFLDFYPSKKSSFHITAGVMAGKSKVIEIKNKDEGSLLPIAQYNSLTSKDNYIGIPLGKYMLTPDSKGNIYSTIETNGVKPYLGIGFGRAVPKKWVGFNVDIGCAFWDDPKIYCNDQQLNEGDVDGDSGKFVKAISKLSIYPVISFRVCGRFF